MADRSWLSLAVIGAVAVVLFYFISRGESISPRVTPTQTGPTVNPDVHVRGSASVGESGLAITEIFSPSYTSTQNTEVQNTTTITPTTTVKLLGLFQ